MTCTVLHAMQALLVKATHVLKFSESRGLRETNTHQHYKRVQKGHQSNFRQNNGSVLRDVQMLIIKIHSKTMCIQLNKNKLWRNFQSAFRTYT